MENVLIILSHPDIQSSIGNKTISDNLNKLPNTEVRHIDSLYPDYKIDVKKEQEALKKADVIIFQYPLFWYNVPAMLKGWIDQVFTYGFAFGKDNYALEGKKIIVSFTTGTSVKDYPNEVTDKIIFPFKGLADFCKMEYLTEVISHEINNYSDEAVEKSKSFADLHAQKITELLTK